MLKASRTSPSSVNAIAEGSANGTGRRSVNMPMNGCSSEAVTWKTKVIMPVWKNVSEYVSRNTGYSAGASDCIMSFSMCEALTAKRIPIAVVCATPMRAASTGAAAPSNFWATLTRDLFGRSRTAWRPQ